MSLNIKTETGRDIIASLGGNVINGAEMQHYSTDERIIGYWTDGKPIYRKVISTTLPVCVSDGTANQSDCALGELNVDDLVSLKYVVRSKTGTNPWQSSGYLFSGDLPTQGVRAYYVDSTNGEIIVVRNAKTSYNGLPIDIIFEYTKTTDVAITNNNTYSTDEVLTGKTWVDGKPIYRKVFTELLTTSLVNPRQWNNLLNVSDLNIDSVVQYTIHRGLETPYNGFVVFDYAGIIDNYFAVRDETFQDMYYLKSVILEYTKTTD